MKQLLILLTAFCLVTTACNNKKESKDRTNTTRDKDDYRNDNKDGDNKDADNNNSRDDNSNTSNTSNNDDNSSNDNSSSRSSNWSTSDANTFVTSCVNSAVSGGMQRAQATSYCECMQVKLEKQYPNVNDVGNLDMESASMKKMVQDCLY